MRTILVVGGLLLSTLSYANNVLNVSITPFFKYQESNYSCHHDEVLHPIEFHLVGDVQNGKLVKAVLNSIEWYHDTSIPLSATELASSGVEADYVGTWWLTKLTLEAPTLKWLFDHLEEEVPDERCPKFRPLNPITITPSTAEFKFTVEYPDSVRYAAPISLRGTRQNGKDVTAYEFSAFGLASQLWGK